jgi:hypothetical protein
MEWSWSIINTAHSSKAQGEHVMALDILQLTHTLFLLHCSYKLSSRYVISHHHWEIIYIEYIMMRRTKEYAAESN